MIDDIVIIEFILVAGFFVLVCIAVLLFERLPKPPKPLITGFKITQIPPKGGPNAKHS